MSTIKAEVIEFLEEVEEDGKVYNKVIMLVPKPKEYDYNPRVEQIQVAHDYVRFHGHQSIEQRVLEDGTYPIKDTVGACNWTSTRGSITIGIRDMYDVVLPFLSKHQYLQAEHFQTRGSGEDAYAPYAYEGSIIQFYDKIKEKQMVTFRRCGETVWETVTLELFQTIASTLQLSLSKKDQEKKEE